jgi:sterol desaturase/sphingolipid hydroxylase (fatty acid hydroxylase superfamily)
MRTHAIKQGKIFKDPFLESLTKSSLVITVLFYGLLVISFFYLSYWFTGLSIRETLLWYGTGILVWTLMEYLLHRYVFHIDKYISAAKRFHYIVHGVHHEQPADKERLFMPPVPGTIIASVLLGIWYVLLGNYTFAFMAGISNGYLIYSFIHYTVHTNPNTKLFRRQWFHHALHHYKYPEKAFGVSSPFWDIIFGTMPPKPVHKIDQPGFSKS